MELSSFVAAGFGAALKAFASKLSTDAASSMYKLFTEKRSSKPGTIDFASYYEYLFDRCTKIKTVINRDEFVDMLSLYVDQYFTVNGNTLSHYEVIEKFEKGQKIILCGAGGCGKTMFQKYLWLTLFNKGGAKIPLSIELRKINELTLQSFEDYILHFVLGETWSEYKSQFIASLKAGSFAFILDGFDEIDPDRRDRFQAQIQALCKNYPKCNFLITSRVDARFEQWDGFTNFFVKPLSQPQVVDLVRKIDFDRATKDRFIKVLKSDFFKKHESFLSTPLLATMMLITFHYYADIPEKVHIFYDQAFDALFLRHDASKESFKRKRWTSHPIDVFKSIFSFFCLITYEANKYEFSETEIYEYIRKSGKLAGVEVEAEQYTRDLLESVCVLQRDGLFICFTHRSLQEYFCAYCIARLPDADVERRLQSICRRDTDSVFSMIYDMKKVVFLERFVVKILAKRKQRLQRAISNSDVCEFLSMFGDGVGLHMSSNFVFIERNGDFLHQMYILRAIFKNEFKRDKQDVFGSFEQFAEFLTSRYNLKLRDSISIDFKNKKVSSTKSSFDYEEVVVQFNRCFSYILNDAISLIKILNGARREIKKFSVNLQEAFD